MPTKKVRRTLLAALVVLVAACGQSENDSEVEKVADEAPVILPAQSEQVRLVGRAQPLESGGYRFGYPGVSLEVAITGGELAMRAHSSGDASYLSVQIDDQAPRAVKVPTEPAMIPLVNDGKAHKVHVSHRSETWHGVVTVESFLLEKGRFAEPPPAPERRMLIIGDSVTCGEAVERQPGCEKNSSWWNPEASYGKRLARALNADVHLVCHGGRGLTRSWNGSTDDAQAPQFFEQTIAQPEGPAWNHADYQPHLVLISLGTNDFSLGIGPLPEEQHFVGTYVQFVKRVLALYPEAQVVLTEGAMVNDEADPSRPQKTVLRNYIAATLKQLNDPRVHQVHSQHYPGDECDAHPTGEQHAAMAEDLTPEVRRIMGW